MTTTARVLLPASDDEDRYLPEGPHVVAVQGRTALAWINIQYDADATSGAVHLWFPDANEHEVLHLPGRPGFFAPTDRPNTLLVGCDKDIALLDATTMDWEVLATIPDADPRTIINDGNVVPGGLGVVFGTKDTKFKDPIANLYLFTVADRRIVVLADRQTCSNGKVFADGGRTLYDIDTPRHRIDRYRFDLDARTATREGVAADLEGTGASPDGMTDCGDGTVIVALYNGHRGGDGRAVRVDLRTGGIVEDWATPGSPRVTCPLLWERGGKVQLVLTTATEGMPADQQAASPHAGLLFVADTSLTAVPAAEVVRVGPAAG